MSLLSPLWLAVAALVGVGVIVAHLFSTRLPPRDLLPTVRFVPEEPPLTVLRSRRVSDLKLLAVRLLAVASLGLAFAGVHLSHRASPRVVVVDISRAVGSLAELRDSVRTVPSDVVIAFDSTARAVATDSLTRTTVRGSLSSGLVAAHRALADAARGRERSELVVVSPFVSEEVDSATATLLALWEGPVRVVRVGAATQPPSLSWEIRAEGDDPVVAALASFKPPTNGCRGGRRGACVAAVRVVRTAPGLADSLWARDSSGVLVIWPNAMETAVESRDGIATAHETVIAPMRQTSRLADGHVLIRWLNGEPAATEHALGLGCVREVAIGVEPIGDLPLRESFRNIARSLVEPCGGSGDFGFAPIPRVQKTATSGKAAAAVGALPLWLVLFAAAVLLVEQRLRR